MIDLDEPNIVMGVGDLWERTRIALAKVVQMLRFKSAVLFHSRNRDFSRMDLCASVPLSFSPPNNFSFESYDEFARLVTIGGIDVPNNAGLLSWITPESVLGAKRGVLFCREVLGHLVVIGFGLSSSLTKRRQHELGDAVSRIFRTLDAGFTAVELDNLMAETGHLMGRAMGKLIAGVQVLKEVSPPPKDEDLPLYRAALWAIEDGENRLELVRQNFYSFQLRRQQVSDLGRLSSIETFDARREVEEMRRYFDRSALEAGLKPIHWEFEDQGGYTLVGDRNAFRLMILNIFDNALKFSYTNTFIACHLSSDGSQFTISVANLGLGVAKDETVSVFQPLYRSRFADDSRRVEGLGLGLSYCKRVVEDFGGEISLVSSEARTSQPKRFAGDNWLTTVTVTLPLRRQVEVDAK